MIPFCNRIINHVMKHQEFFKSLAQIWHTRDLYIYIYIYIYIYMPSFLYVCICACVWECVCIFIHIYDQKEPSIAWDKNNILNHITFQINSTFLINFKAFQILTGTRRDIRPKKIPLKHSLRWKKFTCQVSLRLIYLSCSTQAHEQWSELHMYIYIYIYGH